MKRATAHPQLLVALAAVVFAIHRSASAFPVGELGLPHDASIHGYHVDSLLKSTGYMLVALFIVLVAWLLWTSLVHGRKHEAHHDHGTSRRAVGTSLGIAAAIFLVVDGHLFLRSFFDLNDVFWNFADVEQRDNTVRIEVNAHQWAWDFRYAGRDGKFNTADDIVSLNDIRVAIHTPILLHLASTDVIHSFFLPNFRVKTDAVPGMVNPLWFEAKELGQFEVACAQHCGVNHYKMKAILTVLSADDYRAWARESSVRATRAYEPQDEEAHWGWEWKTRK